MIKEINHISEELKQFIAKVRTYEDQIPRLTNEIEALGRRLKEAQEANQAERAKSGKILAEAKVQSEKMLANAKEAQDKAVKLLQENSEQALKLEDSLKLVEAEKSFLQREKDVLAAKKAEIEARVAKIEAALK